MLGKSRVVQCRQLPTTLDGVLCSSSNNCYSQKSLSKIDRKSAGNLKQTRKSSYRIHLSVLLFFSREDKLVYQMDEMSPIFFMLSEARNLQQITCRVAAHASFTDRL